MWIYVCQVRDSGLPQNIFVSFFQCCSEFLILPTPSKVSNRCENTTKLRLTALVDDSLIGMGKNNAGDYPGDACLYRQYGRWWATWQKPDMDKNSRKAPSPHLACRGSQYPHWPRPHWETKKEMGHLGWNGKQWSHQECPLLSSRWDGKFYSVLFCSIYLFIYPFIFLSVSS